VARRAAKITAERKQNGFVLVLDAGNSLTGDTDPARKTRGQTSIEVMNKLGYDALAVGAQDLGLGADVLQKRISEAQFAVLSANAIVSATGKLVATPFVLRKTDGHTLALIGLSNGGTKEILVRDPVQSIQAVLAEIANTADIVIVLSHAGAVVDQNIADTVPGIDLIVSGGEPALQAPWRSAKTGALVLRADQATPGHAGRVLGVGQFTFDPRGHLAEQKWQSVPLTPEIADDPAITTWVQQQTSR
jgi:5'-nucleotidase